MAKKTDSGPRPSDAPGQPPSHRVHVPPAWLTAILAIMIVPWLIVAAVYVSTTNGAKSSSSSLGTPAASVDAGAGPWGRLSVSPIVISPPLEYVSPEGGRNAPPQWAFPGVSRDVVQAFLTSAGLPPSDVSTLMARSRMVPDIQGILIAPDPKWIRSFGRDVRARIYGELGKSRLNFDQDQAFRFLGSSPAEWLDGSPISAETRALVEPLIYRQGSFQYFADIETIRHELKDQTELQRLIKTLQRHSTLLLRLTIEPGTNTDDLAEYWGRGGRRTDIKPLLESLADGRGSGMIDVVHLLPTLARNHLYRYPKLTADDFDRPVIANCLWTALNFFRNQPDDRFLDPDFAIQTLKKEYYVVEHGFELGDVVAFLDDEGDLFHVAVYIADGIAFSKNGTSPLSPWTFMRIDHIKEYYGSTASNIRLIYHRRSDH